jgi:hypothetical protein
VPAEAEHRIAASIVLHLELRPVAPGLRVHVGQL